MAPSSSSHGSARRWSGNGAPKILILLLFLLIPPALSAAAATETDHGRDYWYRKAREDIEEVLAMGNGERPGGRAWEVGVARNVVLFVGDGMGLSTVTAARILRGQQMGASGEEHKLAFEKFPHLALAKTYNADAQIGESSACATALLCGVRANAETVGVDATARFDDCHASHSARVPSLLDWAHHEGKATGIVTTTRVTHGTPAALYAHSASRYWEDDGKVPPKSRNACKDIARQLVEDDPGRQINVVLGGGRRHLLPKVAQDPETGSEAEEGRRLDGRNLVEDWLRDKRTRGLRGHYVWNKGQFEAVNPKYIDHLLGLFAYSHMDFEADRDTSAEGDPSLAEMTKKAIQILQKNPHGFFLFVEGGRIDHAHHYNNAYRALQETLALEAALEAALPLLDPERTLVVLTADHSHVLTLGGTGTKRGNPILGVDAKVSDVDGLPYTTLLYSSGPGFGRENLTSVDTGAKNVVQQSAVPRLWATHGGEDVPVYAKGPGSSLFRGSVDQTYIPHAIAYAACIGEHKERCRRKPTPSPPPSLLPLATGNDNKMAAREPEDSPMGNPEDCAKPLSGPVAPPPTSGALGGPGPHWSSLVYLLLHALARRRLRDVNPSGPELESCVHIAIYCYYYFYSNYVNESNYFYKFVSVKIS
ncbi:alkaline phosphatase, tissue-nonspecific isozyme-like [Ischnura elegans]|uniref:alkaline phosphatase, tissue-nonspecific isozyme-like n=1 Tax=Ischnura elegans TaxID=197161 RepID=UPI001ED880EB|nr:alkaline phosphatase, tissue-nonspecific isozyme-like [Ischnura elegans]